MLKLREVERMPNHDRFGLAVLIFHLLFVGRHPFAGRFRGAGDLSIEKAIAERRFAFSKFKAETLVDPPPASLLLDDLPPSVGELFEAAFRGQNGEARPTPIQWVEQLEALMKRRKACSYDAIHVYFSQLSECPWCRIEDSGGPAFFVPSAGTSGVSEDRLATLDDRIWKLKDVVFPELTAERIALPAVPPIKAPKSRAKFAAPDFTTLSLVASWLVCFAAVFLSHPWSLVGLGAGSALSLIYGLLLILGKQAGTRRQAVEDFHQSLETAKTALTKRAQAMEYHHRQQESSFGRTADDLKAEIDRYRHAGENLRDVIAQNQESHKADFLRQFLIRDYGRRIPTLTASQVTMLESYSVESANDVTRLKLYGIPSIDPETVMELMQWRAEVERGFVFNPDHGITLADVGALKDAAVRRFKISQARKILTAARQLDSLADIGRTDLARSLVAFDDASDQWRNTARQLQEFEASRRVPERWINRSWTSIMAWSLGVPLAAAILYLLVR
jgi:DNA-binding helix-hairpin-helix protein with protein kinase domain